MWLYNDANDLLGAINQIRSDVGDGKPIGISQLEGLHQASIDFITKVSAAYEEATRDSFRDELHLRLDQSVSAVLQDCVHYKKLMAVNGQESRLFRTTEIFASTHKMRDALTNYVKMCPEYGSSLSDDGRAVHEKALRFYGELNVIRHSLPTSPVGKKMEQAHRAEDKRLNRADKLDEKALSWMARDKMEANRQSSTAITHILSAVSLAKKGDAQSLQSANNILDTTVAGCVNEARKLTRTHAAKFKNVQEIEEVEDEPLYDKVMKSKATFKSFTKPNFSKFANRSF